MMYLIKGGKMSPSYEKILKLETKLEDLDIDNEDKRDSILLQISNLLDKIDNMELLDLYSEPYVLNSFINIPLYFKKYKLDKKKLKEDNSYKEEFKKVNLLIEELREKSNNEEDYLFLCYKCDVDNVASYLLKNMSNEDIMELANSSDDWNYKLFLFENLKK